MSEFEERLNAILSDPAEMEKITRLAGQLLGADGEGTAAAQEPAGGDGALFGTLAGLLRSDSGGGDKTALVSALSPYLRPARRQRLQKALRLAKAARLAAVMLRADGGEQDV